MVRSEGKAWPPKPGVFLDKDGTLVEDVPYNVNPEQVRLAVGTGEGLATLQSAGYRLVVISNQSGVAHGLFAEEALGAIQCRLGQLLQRFGVVLDGFYYCPHHPQGSVPAYTRACTCRKPEPGLIIRGAEDLNIDLRQSWVVGDILDDVEAGRRAGCRTILIDNGNETEWQLSRQRGPDHVARDLAEAARIILAGSPPGSKGLVQIAEREANHER
jgi:histidinol-phosphate phosphatase family protein